MTNAHNERANARAMPSDRRAFLRGALTAGATVAAAGAVAVPAGAVGVATSATSILAGELAAAWAEQHKAIDNEWSDEATDAAFLRGSEVAKRILALTTKDMETLKLKAMTLFYCYDGDLDECLACTFNRPGTIETDARELTTDVRLAHSILRDLIDLAGVPAGVESQEAI